MSRRFFLLGTWCPPFFSLLSLLSRSRRVDFVNSKSVLPILFCGWASRGSLLQMQRFLRPWFSGCGVAPRNLGFWQILQRFPYRWSLYEALWAALLPGWQCRLRCHLHWHIALHTEGAAWDTVVLGGTCGGFRGAGVSVGWRRGCVGKRKGASLSWELAPCPFPPGSLRLPGHSHTFLCQLYLTLSTSPESRIPWFSLLLKSDFQLVKI